jgi:hypothetical protein
MRTKDPLTNRAAEVTFDNVSFASKEGKETGRETIKDMRSKSGKKIISFLNCKTISSLLHFTKRL